MVAYTRQSTISDGDTITAALFNNEYNQLLSAFSYASSGTTGHKHDGTAGEGGHVPQIGDQDFLNKIVTDSTNNRFGIFVQVSSSAVEQIRIQDGAIVPVTDNDIDLGTSSVEFKDAYFDGTVTTDALVADTADINGGTVDGATIGASSATTGVFTTIQGSTITATTAFVPDASDGAALGTSSLEFSDLFLADGAVINFGDDQDVTLTHVADTGLLLNSTMQLQFNDSSQYINAPSATVLDINATDEIELNATLVDINANVEVSGTLTVAGAVDFGDAALSNVGAVQLDSVAGDGDTDTSITFSGSDVITIATGGTTAMTLDASQNVTIAGDLTITGDDLTMGTNTSGMLLIADGTNFNPTAVTSLSEISTVANDDVFLAIDTSGGGLKKIERSAIVSGLASSSAISNVVEDTTPQLGGDLDTNSQNILIDDAHFIGDENGNEQIIFQTTSSAVNQIDVTNAATGNAPEIAATGGDTNVSLKLTPKGSGQVLIDGNVGIETGLIDLKNGGSQSAVRLYCESSNAHYAAIQAPAHSDFAGNVTLTLPATTDTLAGIAATQTLTNKTLTTPVIAEIDSGSTITLDATTDIVLDADGGDIFFKDDGTTFGSATNTSGNLIIKSGTTTALTFSGANVTAAGTYTGGGTMTTGGNIVIPDAGNIGSVSDTDAIAIASDGVVTFSQVPVLPDDTVATADIQDNAVTLAKMAGIARGKIIVGDASGDPSVLSAGSNGTFLKSDGTDLSFAAPSVALDDVATGDAAVTLATSAGNITIDAQGNDTDIILKGTDDSSDTTFLTIDGSDAGTASFNHDVKLANDAAVLGFGADNDVTITHVHDTGIKLNSTLHLEKSDSTTYDGTDNAGQVTVGPTIYLENPANANDTVGGQIVFGMRSTEVQARIGATGGTSPSLVFGTGDVQAIEIDSNQDLKLTTDSAVLGFGADNDVTLTHTADTGLTLSAGANITQYTISSTNDGSSAGPYINLDRFGGSAADNDALGIIQWRGENDAGTPENIQYAQMYTNISDVTDGSETAYMQCNVMNAGTLETPFYVNSGGKLYVYNNNTTDVALRVRQDNASNTNYGVISQTDGTGTAGYFKTAGAGTALYGYCGGAHYGVRGYSASNYGAYLSAGSSGYGSYSGASGKKYLIGGYSSTYGSYSNGSYYSSTNTYTGSDSRLKDVTSQITTSDGILAKVNSLKPIMYTWKENSDGYVKDASPECGFLAQEVKDVFPDLITETEVPDLSDEMYDNGRDTKTLNEELGTTYGMSYEKLSVYLAAALQEASAKIDALEARIKTLEDA